MNLAPTHDDNYGMLIFKYKLSFFHFNRIQSEPFEEGARRATGAKGSPHAFDSPIQLAKITANEHFL